ncbi:MAG: hypothetical protein R3313_05440, partial [Candidatus Saccharimonadales bacterium]|nr:hypothetical protein [Candidatus Saccharimonadales bacterium]
MKKKIRVPYEDGHLVGVYENPTERTEGPLVVIAHGFNSSKDLASSTIDAAKRLKQIGLATIRYDA